MASELDSSLAVPEHHSTDEAGGEDHPLLQPKIMATKKDVAVMSDGLDGHDGGHGEGETVKDAVPVPPEASGFAGLAETHSIDASFGNSVPNPDDLIRQKIRSMAARRGNERPDQITTGPFAGVTWEDRKSAVAAIKAYVTSQHRQVKLDRRSLGGNATVLRCTEGLDKNCTKRVAAEGESEPCPFVIRAKKTQTTEKQCWYVSKNSVFTHSEECKGMSRPGTEQLSQMDVIRDVIVQNPQWSGRSTCDYIKAQYGHDVPLHTFYRVKQLLSEEARTFVFHDIKLLESWCSRMESLNPGTRTYFARDSNDSLKHAIVVPAQSAHVAVQGALPVVFLKTIAANSRDCPCFLVSLLIKDGEDTTVPLSFGVFSTLTVDSYKTILRETCEVAGEFLQVEGLLAYYSNDRAATALKEILPSAYLLKDPQSIAKRIQRMTDRTFPLSSFWRLHGAVTEKDFNEEFSRVANTNGKVTEYLNELRPENWGTYIGINKGVRLLGVSVNARDLPALEAEMLRTEDSLWSPLVFLDAMVLNLTDILSKGRHQTHKLTSNTSQRALLTEHAQGIFDRDLLIATASQVHECSDDVGLVTQIEGGQECRRRVSLSSRMCTCYGWQLHGLPCSHAVAYARRKTPNAFPNPSFVEFAFEKAYWSSSYAEAYNDVSIQVPLKDELVSDERTVPQKAHPPKRKPGRPSRQPVTVDEPDLEDPVTTDGALGISPPPQKKARTRMREQPEAKRRHRCSRCGQRGHHRSTCPCDDNPPHSTRRQTDADILAMHPRTFGSQDRATGDSSTHPSSARNALPDNEDDGQVSEGETVLDEERDAHHNGRDEVDEHRTEAAIEVNERDA